MGARVYDPDTGTFLQTDPIPGADANAYGYANGDPVNETDLTGKRGSFGSGCLVAPNPEACAKHADAAIKKWPTPSLGSLARAAGDIATGGICVASGGTACVAALVVNTAFHVTQDVTSRGSTGTKIGRAGLDVALGIGDGVFSWGDELMARGVAAAPRILINTQKTIHAGGSVALDMGSR
jgi:hypothetical protein